MEGRKGNNRIEEDNYSTVWAVLNKLTVMVSLRSDSF